MDEVREMLEYRVMVKPDPVEEKTAGGIILPGSVKDQEQMAAVKGTIVKMSDMAFTDGAGKAWPCVRPAVGDRVMFSKYAGMAALGEDGKGFRFLNDKEIICILEQEK